MMARKTKENRKHRDHLRFMLSYLSNKKGQLICLFLLAVLSVAATLYLPYLIGEAIDAAVGVGQVDFVRISAMLLQACLTVALGALAQYLVQVIGNSLTYHIVRAMREDSFSKISKLPFSYLDTHQAGETVSRIITDVDTMAEGLLMGFTQLFSGVLTILGTLAFMVYMNVWVALFVVLVTPLSLFVARFITSHTYSMFRRQSEVRGRQTAFINEMIGNQKVVAAFSHEDENVAAFDVMNEELRLASLRAIFYSSLTNPCTRFVNNLAYAGVCLIGALLILSPDSFFALGGVITVGNLATLLAYATQYTKPFNEISEVIAELQNALACAGRVNDLMTAEEETPDPADAVIPERFKGQVELKDVAFAYTPARPLIESLSLSVAPGKRVAIVGPTGCGKTTLINLLMRFYDVDSGEISVDGIPVRKMTRHALRSQMGMVLQDTWIMHGTVRENIRLFRPGVTDEEVVEAAKAVHAHSFIRRLPQGYDTVIGEDGGLSQGQRQLLCIARVMLALPPMLILDEATSSIDTRTELVVQEAFAALMRGRTSFIVAHRLSTIRDADLILVMRDGHVIETGTHDSLLARGGFYAELFRAQFATE